MTHSIVEALPGCTRGTEGGILYESGGKFPLVLGPSGERGGEDQKIQGRIDELEGRVPSAPSSQGGAHPRASE